MYEAIVLLPLLGAMIAGVIALVGAHARHRRGAPPSPAEHRSGPPVAERPPHGPPSPPADGAVIPVSHDEPHHAQPPARGSLAAELTTTALLLVSWALSLLAFVWVGFLHQEARVLLAT